MWGISRSSDGLRFGPRGIRHRFATALAESCTFFALGPTVWTIHVARLMAFRVSATGRCWMVSQTREVGGRGSARVFGDSLGDRVVVAGELDGLVGELGGHFGERFAVVARLEVGEFQAVGGGDDDDPFVGYMTSLLASFMRTAMATPVWGQANRPVLSARAAACDSSSSVACSTTPSNSWRIEWRAAR